MGAPRRAGIRDGSGMAFTFAPADPSSDAVWAVFEARRLLREGAERIEQACSRLMMLADTADWHSAGISALHRCLETNADALAVIGARVQVEAQRLPY